MWSQTLLLSRFSRVWLCATPETAAHQALPSLGFSRQEHWSGLPFPFPMHESESEVTQSCQTPSDLMDCSLPGSSIHGIFQARVVEWGAIALWGQRETNHQEQPWGLVLFPRQWDIFFYFAQNSVSNIWFGTSVQRSWAFDITCTS